MSYEKKKFASETVAPLWKRENDYGEYFSSIPITDEMKELIANAATGSSFFVRSLKDSARKNEKSPTHYLDIREAKEGASAAPASKKSPF